MARQKALMVFGNDSQRNMYAFCDLRFTLGFNARHENDCDFDHDTSVNQASYSVLLKSSSESAIRQCFLTFNQTGRLFRNETTSSSKKGNRASLPWSDIHLMRVKLGYFSQGLPTYSASTYHAISQSVSLSVCPSLCLPLSPSVSQSVRHPRFNQSVILLVS